ncbi:enoyl-CoA hydratase/carnithine racemase [Cerasibacillus quisquiliarum]|uniref:Enoyl-CoA hydratase n=1 Tax=Cerasibacillus quisquiliarum TaxID=227865 RepID=A0A511UYX5_9BACI|nr:enoyl-CoA hydratase/isomerase family protein [Cerasibacillus quisquiliarum]MBB5145761.1 enoyl-CoA hydratase/carnithine racemase [Cerasibacillus quisquiliarum]GEN30332.1 enoyl-CoA hydratase [Cerasibacillus quisquiliarum]
MVAGDVTYHFNKEHLYGLIRIERPEKHNAISDDMICSFYKAIQNAKANQSKCLVITGAGERMFSSGGDLRDLNIDLSVDEAYRKLSNMQVVLQEILAFPVPVICLLNGDALGGGCEIATACDIRIAKEGTKFGFVQSTIGITPAWGGGAILYEKVHPSFAFHWLTQGKIYSDRLLEKKGWIHERIPEVKWDSLEEIIAPYLQKSRQLLQTLKRQYQDKLSLEKLIGEMENEVKQCSTLWHTKEHIHAVNRFLKGKQLHKLKH